jgi:hypothetical protein
MAQFDAEIVKALARLRHAALNQPALSKVDFDALDNAGVFAALDEQADCAQAEDILAESAAMSAVAHTNIPPAEALQVLHNTWNRGGRVTVQARAKRAVKAQMEETDLAQAARMVDSLRPKGRSRELGSDGTPAHIHFGCGLDCTR